MDLRQTFDDLVRLETEIWNSVDRRLVQECGVTLGTFNALLIVASTPGCRVNDLAAALAITVGGISQAVDRIEARGLLARVPNPANRRSSLLEVTAEGRAALKSASVVFDDELEQIFGDPLSGADRERLSRGLSALRAAVAVRRTGPLTTP